ncbi:MAG: PAS domain S-box protein [Melioribacteraceae bacterium]|nr:PAS domain S-box protein [Melioribacteraceae bacterium]
MKIKFLHNTSLKNKLVFIIIGTSTFAVILVLLLYSVLDIINYKAEMKENASLNAELAGNYSSAALLFGYSDEATELLKALEAIPSITNACIYDKDRNVFAGYHRSADQKYSFPSAQQEGENFEGGYLYVFKPIYQNGDQIGTIFLRVSTSELNTKIASSIILFFLFIILLSGPVFFLASKLQSLVSDPILKLADAATNFSENQNYEIKINSNRKDEIGVLYRQFNFMFDKIKKATTELKSLNEELEKRVELRTAELEKSNRELKLTERAHRDSEERLRSILNRAPLLVYINDLEGKYIFVNKEFLRHTGFSLEEIIGKTDDELFPEHRAKRNLLQNKKVINTKKTQYFENESIKEDGVHYFVDILFPISDSDNDIYATCGWTIDITERKKYEDALLQAKESAESADRLKSAFLATMSHELRTPLNSIIGFTGILMKELAGPLNEEQKKQLNMIMSSGKHLLDLINDVLDISKIEAGELVVQLDKFDFKQSLRKVISIVEPLAEKKFLEIRVNIDPKISSIVSDGRRVEQIFLNLLNNAVKFTEEGYIEICSELKNGCVVTSVKDTGVGIKPEDLAKLFKPFSQIDTGITRTHEGTGLGLSICKKLLEKLNGKIKVESEYNSGSTFIVELPLNGEKNES